MDTRELTRFIRNKLHIHHRDILPFTGWDRSITRVTLAEIIGAAGFKVGAEIGVHKGEYSKVLCEKIPGVKLHCVDPWTPYRGRRPSQERMDLYLESAKRRLAGFDVNFIRKTSVEAAKDFADGSLDFVYIDAMHEFDPVMMDIISWVPKVKMGGIVSGHDYIEAYAVGVINAVKAYTTSHNVNEWYLTNDGNNATDVGKAMDNPRSFFWVRMWNQ